MDKLIRLPEILTITGLSRSSIYRMEESGHFPKRLKIATRIVAWRQTDILEWVKSRSSVAA